MPLMFYISDEGPQLRTSGEGETFFFNTKKLVHTTGESKKQSLT